MSGAWDSVNVSDFLTDVVSFQAGINENQRGRSLTQTRFALNLEMSNEVFFDLGDHEVHLLSEASNVPLFSVGRCRDSMLS